MSLGIRLLLGLAAIGCACGNDGGGDVELVFERIHVTSDVVERTAWPQADNDPDLVVVSQAGEMSFHALDFEAANLAGATDLPPGRAYLRFPAGTYVEIQRGRNIFEDHRLGRSDAVETRAGSTAIAGMLDRVEPWQENDSFQLFSPDSGTHLWLPDGGLSSPTAGDTSLVFEFGYDQVRGVDWPLLVDSRLGDSVYVSQVRPGSDPGWWTASAVASAREDDLSQPVGQRSEFVLALASAPGHEGEIARPSGLLAQATTMHPDASFVGLSLSLAALPQANRFGRFDQRGLFLWEATAIGPESAAGASIRYSFVADVPEDWYTLTAVAAVDVTVQLPGSSPATFPAQCWLERTGLDDWSNVLTDALVEAPAPIFVDGRLVEEGAEFRRSPAVSWASGNGDTPDRYALDIYRVFRELYPDGSSSYTDYERVADIWTFEPQLALPPQLLQAGECYFFSLRALVEEPTASGQATRVSPWFCVVE
jgi:hypothetical protein